MINFIQNGNLFESKCEAWINTVNCVGIMGKGIALEFKNRFPKMYYEYKNECIFKNIKPGSIWQYNNNTYTPSFILNFATKNHWRDPSRIEWINSGLKKLREIIEYETIESVAIPPIGCGNGKLDWNIVKPLITSELMYLTKDVLIEVYEPKI